MSSIPGEYLFFQVPFAGAAEAYDFHSRFYRKEYIWTRSEEQLKQFAKDGQLFAIRDLGSHELVGICYLVLDDENNRWELGGLGVTKNAQKLGLGTVLARFALARTIAEKSPWRSDQEIIAHVHEGNQDPRGGLARLGFQYSGKEEISGDAAPSSLPRNEDGKVVGEVFIFPKSSAEGLSKAIKSDFSGFLRDGKTKATFDLGIWSLQNLQEALIEAAGERN